MTVIEKAGFGYGIELESDRVTCVTYVTLISGFFICTRVMREKTEINVTCVTEHKMCHGAGT